MSATRSLSEPFTSTAAAEDDPLSLTAGTDLLESWKKAATTAPPSAPPTASAHSQVTDAPSEAAEGASAFAGEDASDEGGTGVRRRRRPRARAIAAAVVVAALVGVAGWLGWGRLGDDHLTAARTGATRSAVAVATKMADYSYQSLNKDFVAVEQASTPSFAQTFKKQSAALVSVLQKYHASSSGHVTDAAVEKWSTTRAEILVVVNQTVKNSATSNSGPQENALLLTMVHQHGRWLLDNVSVR